MFPSIFLAAIFAHYVLSIATVLECADPCIDPIAKLTPYLIVCEVDKNFNAFIMCARELCNASDMNFTRSQAVNECANRGKNYSLPPGSGSSSSVFSNMRPSSILDVMSASAPTTFISSSMTNMDISPSTPISSALQPTFAQESSQDSSSSDESETAGIIVGTIVGVAAIVFGACMVILVRRRCRANKQKAKEDQRKAQINPFRPDPEGEGRMVSISIQKPPVYLSLPRSSSSPSENSAFLKAIPLSVSETIDNEAVPPPYVP